MAQEVFNRYELKYIMDKELFEKVYEMINEHLILDVYGDNGGHYTVVNLYFDTPEFFFNQQIIAREPFRQKLRLRIYDGAGPDDPSFIEIKKKYDGIVNKRRTVAKLHNSNKYLGLIDGEKSGLDFAVSNRQVLNEIEMFRNIYNLEPKMVLAYDRQAFHSAEESGVRVTFDQNIRCRWEDFDLSHGGYGDLFVPEDFVIMEVKVLDAVPIWLVEMFNKFNIHKQRFSKYSHAVEWKEKNGTDYVSDYVIQHYQGDR